MKWLSFVNGVIGIALILTAVSGLVSHEAGVAVAVAGLVVLVLGALRWVTGFARFSADRVRAQLPH
ncbi:MAG: hypothetical protein ACREOM_07905 [Candidatus Dormibacteraceae bacterium]